MAENLNNRVVFGLAYALVWVLAVSLFEVTFWLFLSLVFAVSWVEGRHLVAKQAPHWRHALMLGLALSFFSLGVLQGYFGKWVTLGFLLSCFVFDTAAYFAGRYFGGAKIVPALSPNKTWSGFVGGTLALMFVGIWLLHSQGFWSWLIVCLMLALAFFAGDVSISALKRRAGVKDTGTLIPGHGGILDRVDSLLIAAPLYWFILFSTGVAG